MENNWLPAITMAVITMLCLWGITAYYAPGEPEEVDLSGVIAAVKNLEKAELSDEQIALITSKIVAEFPEMKDLNNKQVRDMWENLYSDEIEALEESAYDAVIEELEEDEDDDWDNLIEFLEEQLGIIIDDDEFYVYSIDDDDTEINVIELGLDDEDDQEVNVHIEFKIRYEDTETDTTYKERVSVDSVVTYDDGEAETEIVYELC